MENIEWTDSLCVANDEINNQHRKVFNLIEQIYNLLDTDFSSSKLDKLIIDLLDALHQHLDYEEKVMSNANYSNLDEHIKQHHKLKEIIDINMMKLQNDNHRSIKEFLDWLSQSWYYHIKNEDMKYKGLI